MTDSDTYRTDAIRYWERKRLWYNAALVVPTLMGFSLSGLANATMRMSRVGLGEILFALMLMIVAANVVFCLAYAFEFLCASRGRPLKQLWLARRVVFAVGLLLAAVLAFIGGRNLAYLQMHGFRII